MGASSNEHSIRRLLDVGRFLTRELDQRVVLDKYKKKFRKMHDLLS